MDQWEGLQTGRRKLLEVILEVPCHDCSDGFIRLCMYKSLPSTFKICSLCNGIHFRDLPSFPAQVTVGIEDGG